MGIRFWFVCTLISFCIFSNGKLHAQEYDRGIGIRLGTANGISYKQFVGSNTAIEGLFVYRRGGTRVTALVEQHLFLDRSSSLYLGVGGHAGYNGWLLENAQSSPAWGLDAEIGFEYVFPYSPLSFGVHVKPMVELHKGTVFSGNNAGFTLRLLY